MWKLGDCPAEHPQLLAVAPTYPCRYITHSGLLRVFLSNFPRLVAWGLEGVQEKGARLPARPSLQLWGTKSNVKTLRRISSSSPARRACWGWGLQWGRQRLSCIGLGSRWLPTSCTSTTENTHKEKAVKLRSRWKRPGEEPFILRIHRREEDLMGKRAFPHPVPQPCSSRADPGPSDGLTWGWEALPARLAAASLG